MTDRPRETGPQPAGPFDHPGAGALTEHSVAETSGYQEDAEYPESANSKEAAARGEALPPRASTDIPRDPIASRTRRP